MIRDFLKQKMLGEKDINKRINALAKEIIIDSKKNKDQTIVIIVILNGAFVFAADLIRAISKIINKESLAIDLIVDALAVHRYGNGTKGSGKITVDKKQLKIIKETYKGTKKIICDDIADEGTTLEFIDKEICDPSNTKKCVLLKKSAKIKSGLNIEYFGFSIPDEYIVGIGMGKGNEGRELPDIWAIDTSKLT